MPTKRVRIALQACERCRQRRTKCDEQRPRCGRCRTQNASCTYGASASSRLEDVEQKVVDLTESLDELRDQFGTLLSTNSPISGPSGSQRRSETASTSSHSDNDAQLDPNLGAKDPLQNPPPDYLTVPHRVILWPCIWQLLIDADLRVESDLKLISEEGTKWFIRREMSKHPNSLPHNVGPSPSNLSVADETQPFAPLNPVTLDYDRMMLYTDAYFRTFNVLLPILDYGVFVRTTLETLSSTGYAEGNIDVVLALCVLALGELASEGTFGQPVTVTEGVSSGFRGGESGNPPGLYLFNQARKRLGFIDCLCTLENIQIYILQASYYAANGHYLEHWKSISAASTTMRALLQSHDFKWKSGLGDMISRAYWACLFQEDLYHLDLDLPPTGIQQYEDGVPMPSFVPQSTSSPADPGSDEWKSYFKHNFLAMIALRRLIVRIHMTIHDSVANRAESPNDYGGAPVPLIREMARQLDSWRSLLPLSMQWLDHEAFEFPNLEPNSPEDHSMLFSHNSGPGPISPVGYERNTDMLTAQLRTRYYYARYLLFRPYVYKALHYPKHMSAEDDDHFVDALYSMCLWPSLMAPPKSKKRLIPQLYAWTQNCLGMLLIFKAVLSNQHLQNLCRERVGNERIQETVSLMLEWIKDAKQVDGTAEWGWKIVEPLFVQDGRLAN